MAAVTKQPAVLKRWENQTGQEFTVAHREPSINGAPPARHHHQGYRNVSGGIAPSLRLTESHGTRTFRRYFRRGTVATPVWGRLGERGRAHHGDVVATAHASALLPGPSFHVVGTVCARRRKRTAFRNGISTAPAGSSPGQFDRRSELKIATSSGNDKLPWN